jgi:hypothetical protein
VTRRERLMATLNGGPVDRPAVNFYEIGGFDVDPGDPDAFNIYNDPSWRPLLDLAERESDITRMRGPLLTPTAANNACEFFKEETWLDGASRFTRTTLSIGGRKMTSLTRRDAAVDTVWEVEHLLKDADDLKAYLTLPDTVFEYDVDVSNLIAEDNRVGDAGIVMVDFADPICHAASLFSMADYTIVAFTEQALFHTLLDKWAKPLTDRAHKVAADFPGRLWRIVGPEYATPPYLPPRLFEEYVVRYTGPIVRAVEATGGFARLHCHGRIKDVLPMIVSMGPSAIDPIEPPPQGNADLAWVRKEYGKDLVLFGNVEVSDIETLPPSKFERKCRQSVHDGTSGTGRGFVLMPTACPYGRKISANVLENYRAMVRLVNE